MRWHHPEVRAVAMVVGILMLGAACARRSAESSADTAAATSLTGVEWRLVELEGQPVVVGTIDAPPHLRFANDTPRVSGSTGCNLLSGSYEISGQTLRFGQLITTKRACVDPDANAQEMRFASALQRVNGFSIDGSGLTLLSGSQPVARFEQRAAGEGDGPR